MNFEDCAHNPVDTGKMPLQSREIWLEVASHSVPMSSASGVPLAGAGIGTVIVVVFVTALRQFARKGLIIPPPRRWSGFVHLAFIATVGEETDHRTGPCPT